MFFVIFFLCHLSIKYVMKRGEVGGRGAPITQLIAAPPARRITKLWLRENNKNNFRKKQLPPTINWRIIWDWKMLTF